MPSKRQLANNVAKEGADDIAKVQNLRLRDKTYWYHRYIPKDVRPLFDEKDQLWISLRSQDFNEAKRLCLQLTLDHTMRRSRRIARDSKKLPLSSLTTTSMPWLRRGPLIGFVLTSG